MEQLEVERMTAARTLAEFKPQRLTAFARQLEEAEQQGTPCNLDLSDEAIAGSAKPSAV